MSSSSPKNDSAHPDPLWHTLLPVVGLTLLAFVLAYQFVDPAPPKQFTLAAGSQGGAYWQVAQRYKVELAKDGISLEVIETRGSVNNLELLGDGKAQVGFVQGGVKPSSDETELRAIGSVYYEPLWVFTNNPALSTLTDFRDQRISIGGEGSGTRALADELFSLNQLRVDQLKLSAASGDEAVKALRSDQLDAVFMVAGAQSERVQSLVRDENIALMDFSRAEAYSRYKRYLSPLVLPRGAIDLPQDRPAADKQLLAVAANLVAAPDIHPALIDLLLQAASRVHADGGLFEEPGEFPSQRLLTLPLHEEAARYYKHGAPLLQRYLPFWAASLIDRLWVMLLPLIAIMIPLMKVMPPLFTWRMRARVYRWYRDLGEVDRALWEGKTEGLADELARIEAEIQQVSVPLSITDELYDLRMHLNLVRDKLNSNRS